LIDPRSKPGLLIGIESLSDFKIAERGTIIGEAWIPIIDLTSDEWSLYVNTLAKGSDRLQYLWTGADQE
jgi:hypothetical protein